MNETSRDKTARKPRVAVVFGGRSSEHGISCVTAGSVLAAIDRDAYDVVPVGIATDGRWVLEADEPARLAIRGNDLPEVDADRSPVALMGATTGTDLVVTDPARAGLANDGKPRSSTRVRTPIGSCSHSVRVTTMPGVTGRPAACSTTFMNALSIPTAEARTPEPT